MSERDTFEGKIKKGLNGLDKTSIVHFAWRCAMYVLPILGGDGNFDFWKKQDRQKYLLSLLRAIDTCKSFVLHSSPGVWDIAIDTYVAAAANAADVYAANVSNIDTITAIAKANAVNAITDAYNAATTAKSSTSTAKAAIKVTIKAANKARTDYDNAIKAADKASANKARIVYNNAIANAIAYDAATTYDATAATFAIFAAVAVADATATFFQRILLEDLSNIKNTRNFSKDSITVIYGETWNNFQKALKDTGCSYWAKLYQHLFEKNFIFDDHDEDLLLRRLNEVPAAILKSGAAEVGRYLEDLETQGAAAFDEARIIILGGKGAGKTCLARRLLDSDAKMTTGGEESTAGVDTSLIWQIGNCNAHIWDFAGHVVTHAVHQFFLSEHCLYIIVNNGRTEDVHHLKYWLDFVKNYGGDSETIIFVNRQDEHPVEVPINTLREKYQIYGNVQVINIKEDKSGLENFKITIKDYITKNPPWSNEKIPKSNFDVKNALEKLFAKRENNEGIEYISKEKFQEIATKYNINDNNELLKRLHDLGIALWYPSLQKYDAMILNPNWISDGIYTIINGGRKAKKYAITLNDYKEIFRDKTERFPNDKYEFFLDLMCKFELAYKSGTGFIIPILLPIDRPEELPDFPNEGSLIMQYRAESRLPPDTISRFIVCQSTDIKDADDVWRYGVVLNDQKETSDSEKVIALVYEEDRTITVKVKGTSREKYIHGLQETLNKIFDTYKSYKTDESRGLSRWYRLIESTGKLGEDLVEEKTIRMHKAKDVPYLSPTDGESKDVSITYITYNIAKVEITNQGNHKEIFMGTKTEQKMVVKENYGQINEGHDHSIINAIQNSGLDRREFQRLVDGFIKALPGNISKEIKNEIEENIDFIKSEMQSDKPKKSLLNNTFNALKKIAEPIGLLTNITQIMEYVQQFIP
ncbi:COR domain-containing protein [Breznakiellaceae bacterium SP9]